MPSPSRLRASLLALVVLALASMVAVTAAEFPPPLGHVNDFAGLLTAAERESLEAQLIELERATSAEVAVVTVGSLDGRPLEEYANALFAEWGIGKRGSDNGVLILVATADRAMRIEVGYGLEGILPDGLAGAIIRERFLPRFREDDYRTGILDGTARVIEIVRRNETLTAEQRAALDAAAAASGPTWLLTALFGLFASLGGFFSGLAARAKVFDDFIGGLVFGAFGVALSVLMKPDANVVVVCGMGALCLFTGLVLGGRRSWRRWMRGVGKGGGGSGWVSGASRGSGSSGGSSGSRGFGGGSSGGGGASGRW